MQQASSLPDCGGCGNDACTTRAVCFRVFTAHYGATTGLPHLEAPRLDAQARDVLRFFSSSFSFVNVLDAPHKAPLHTVIDVGRNACAELRTAAGGMRRRPAERQVRTDSDSESGVSMHLFSSTVAGSARWKGSTVRAVAALGAARGRSGWRGVLIAEALADDVEARREDCGAIFAYVALRRVHEVGQFAMHSTCQPRCNVSTMLPALAGDVAKRLHGP